MEELYALYLEDPNSVDPSWLPVFQEYFGNERNGMLGAVRPSFRPRSIFAPAIVESHGASGPSEAEWALDVSKAPIKTPGKSTKFAARVQGLINAYRLHGHLIADIDPLGRPRRAQVPELNPSYYRIEESDMDAPVKTAELFGQQEVPLKKVIDRLKELYTGHIAVEFHNIPDPSEREWLREQIELNDFAAIDGPDEKARIYQDLVNAESFENFLHTKYVGAKRFGASGGESLIPLLTTILHEGGNLGVEEAILGMAHRGRLNVLHNVMGKPAEAMFSEFEKAPNPEDYLGSSDVKYHMGYSSDFETNTGKSVHLSLTFNPSHLEFVNPVVLGRSRAKQDRRNNGRSAVLPLILHGDAAFSGQGIVTESLNLSAVEGFQVAGSIHVVINNQIGFTALPQESRSTTYSTDIAKILEVPIFHVNGDDPEACVRVAKLAMRWRQKFKQDVVIDLICYRRYGHNEGDEPRFTQPVMYKAIDAMTPVVEKYAAQLAKEDVLEDAKAKSIVQKRLAEYSEVYDRIHTNPRRAEVSTLDGVWEDYKGGDFDQNAKIKTGLEDSVLRKLGHQLATVPESVTLHRTIRRLLKQRGEMADGTRPVDWGMGEGLALASLLTEGTNIRLTGQDVVRATFSQRHAAVTDSVTGERYWPPRNLAEEQGKFEVHNSILSEAGVLGFEYGYSLDFPDSLVLWEAQFGDFANGAQVIIDQFISSGEDKWKRLSGLVMLLPHGFEGQGPEHSSARLGRYLQLSAEDNWFVCNLTTPAQYFHVLRRQMHMPLRKPLIIMTPKSLLRHRAAVSTVEDLAEGHFQQIIGETRPEVVPENVKRVVLCSGKVYYDLIHYAEEKEYVETAIVRVEQIYPLNTDAIQEAIDVFPADAEMLWVQEEPKNMGAWTFILDRWVDKMGTSRLPRYIGRPESASPATGAHESHELEQQKLMASAFGEE